jgi:hypothetical protein
MHLIPLSLPALRALLFRPAFAGGLALLIVPASAGLAAAPGTDAPPAFPDAAHVLNGCYLSTTAYLARFHAAFPQERGAPLAVEPRGFQSRHTIAVVSWRGAWWGRDENFGVFAIDRSVAGTPDPEKLVRHAENALSRHAQREVAAGRGEFARRAPTTMPAEKRLELVARAADLVPHRAEILWVAGGNEALPFLFFRPGPREIAVYDPIHGTATAETDATDPVAIVSVVAARLGYRVAAVRATPPLAAGMTLAAAGGLAR